VYSRNTGRTFSDKQQADIALLHRECSVAGIYMQLALRQKLRPSYLMRSFPVRSPAFEVKLKRELPSATLIPRSSRLIGK